MKTTLKIVLVDGGYFNIEHEFINASESEVRAMAEDIGKNGAWGKYVFYPVHQIKFIVLQSE